MLQREESDVKGGILCDEMGLGKTIQMVALIKSGKGLTNLLVAPVAVLEQWKKVIWKSEMNVSTPSPNWKNEGVVIKGAPTVFCIGYEAAARKPWLVTGIEWDRFIYDEAHRIASNNTGTQLALRITAKRKWLLTGTPVVNKLRDLRILLELIGLEDVPATDDLEQLTPLIKEYVMARTMDQLRSCMPDAPKRPIHKVEKLDFRSPAEEQFYQDKADIIARRLNRLGGGLGATLERLKLIMRLRQVSLHPQIYNEACKKRLGSHWTLPDWTEISTKFEAIQNLIRDATESHKWIVFCHFRDEMEMLDKMLCGEPAVELVQQYHGGLSASQKEEVIDKTHLPIMEGKQEVLLVQLQSGGTGLNLQHFDHIIFTGPWWTQALMEQAVGRAVRIGQTKQVIVYHMLLKAESTDENTNIDSFMREKAEFKGGLCRKVLNAANGAVKLTELSTH
jgi:SNF2 family DNA or RNA helicase